MFTDCCSVGDVKWQKLGAAKQCRKKSKRRLKVFCFVQYLIWACSLPSIAQCVQNLDINTIISINTVAQSQDEVNGPSHNYQAILNLTLRDWGVSMSQEFPTACSDITHTWMPTLKVFLSDPFRRDESPEHCRPASAAPLRRRCDVV